MLSLFQNFILIHFFTRPAKPNAEMSSLGRIRRACDVSVSVDAQSAVITASNLIVNIIYHMHTVPLEVILTHLVINCFNPGFLLDLAT
jgi:hypothetical protein